MKTFHMFQYGTAANSVDLGKAFVSLSPSKFDP